jgi:hypothetical protein
MREQRDFDGVGNQIVVGAAARNLAEQVDVTGSCGEGKVQTCAQRGGRPLERKAARGATQVGLERA